MLPLKINCLRVLKRKPSVWTVFAQAALVVVWMAVFENADPNAIGCVYLFTGFAGLYCLVSTYRAGENAGLSGKTVGTMVLLAGLFALAPVMANYRLFEPVRSVKSLVKFTVCMAGGVVIGWQVLLWMITRLPVQGCGARKHPVRFFLLCFAGISIVYLGYLFTVAYPGYFTKDTQTAFSDVLSGYYGRRIPVYHTLLIKLCLNIGYLLGGTGNSAIVVYPVLQSLALAAGCAYVLVTLYETGVPGWCMAIVMLVYVCIPYHMIYAVTIWKDVAFSIAGFVIAVSLYRTVCRIGNNTGNHVVFGISSFAFCLLRTNGWYSFLAILILLAIALGKRGRKVLLIACVILIVAWVLLNPVLDAVNPETPDYLEPLSIPLQQVARVIWGDYDVPEGDIQFLSRYFDLEMVADLYDPYQVDPIKYRCFDRSKMQSFRSELGDYAALWLRWGLQHPGDYVKAWIDQTKGYWNAGYEAGIYAIEGEYEPLGIVRQTYDGGIANLYRDMIAGIEGTSLYKLFCGIGLHVWALVSCMAVSILQKRKEYLIGIPALVVIVGLWLCAPVSTAFRYAYLVSLTVPFLLSVTVFKKT